MPPKPNLTKLELQIMHVLWRPGASTVTAVQQGLEQQLAYTSVQTMLNILERKGQLRRKLQGRAFVYSPAVTQAKAARHAVRDLIERMFGGSSEELVMSLVQSRDLDAAKLRQLSQRLDEQEKGDDA